MRGELQELGRAVKQAQYRQHRALDSALQAVGTTLAQWDALRAIGNSPGASARELASATFQTEQAFGTLAGRLTAQNLVERGIPKGPKVGEILAQARQAWLAEGCRTDEAYAKDLLRRVLEKAQSSSWTECSVDPGSSAG